MPVFIFQFKVRPRFGHHITVKHGYAAVYVSANNIQDATAKARQRLTADKWIISSVVTSGHEYNPNTHGLPAEALELYKQAESNGVAVGIAAVGFDPTGAGEKN